MFLILINCFCINQTELLDEIIKNERNKLRMNIHNLYNSIMISRVTNIKKQEFIFILFFTASSYKNLIKHIKQYSILKQYDGFLEKFIAYRKYLKIKKLTNIYSKYLYQKIYNLETSSDFKLQYECFLRFINIESKNYNFYIKILKISRIIYKNSIFN